MDASDVALVLQGLEDAGVGVWVDGGWGVDALLGEETRLHEDLDMVVDIAHVPAATAAMERIGFKPTHDELPTRLEMRDTSGRQLDFHPVEFDAAGGGVQQLQDGTWFTYPAEGFEARGSIGRRVVRCLSAAVQILCHSGYEPGPKDVRDVRLLSERFGLPLPPGYPPPCA